MTGLEREKIVMEYVLREMSQKNNDLDDADADESPRRFQ